MLCGAVGPLAACNSSTDNKACNFPVSLDSSTVSPGESLRATIMKPTCFDDMSASQKKSEVVALEISGVKGWTPISVSFINGKFTHDFTIPRSAKPGKASLEIPYQCKDGASCASQSVPFTIVK